MQKLDRQPSASKSNWGDSAGYQYQFQHPIVNDLAFAIGAPELLACLPDGLQTATRPWNISAPDFWKGHYHHYQRRLQQLDHSPDELQDFIAGFQQRRLGHYFERLLHFWLLDTAFHPFQLLAQGIQLFDESGQTAGETDFLVFNTETGLTEHWEVCVKFYHGTPPFSPQQWTGLNREDSLLRKLNHLSRQFRWNKVQEYRVDSRRAVVKGRLFWPATSSLPDNLGTELITKWYYQQTEYLKTGRLIQQLAWINPAHPTGVYLEYAPEDLLKHCKKLRRSQWLSCGQGSDDQISSHVPLSHLFVNPAGIYIFKPDQQTRLLPLMLAHN